MCVYVCVCVRVCVCICVCMCICMCVYVCVYVCVVCSRCTNTRSLSFVCVLCMYGIHRVVMAVYTCICVCADGCMYMYHCGDGFFIHLYTCRCTNVHWVKVE